MKFNRNLPKIIFAASFFGVVISAHAAKQNFILKNNLTENIYWGISLYEKATKDNLKLLRPGERISGEIDNKQNQNVYLLLVTADRNGMMYTFPAQKNIIIAVLRDKKTKKLTVEPSKVLGFLMGDNVTKEDCEGKEKEYQLPTIISLPK